MERVLVGGELGSQNVGLARHMRPVLDMIRLALRMAPGDVKIRKLAQQLRQSVERGAGVGSADYAVVRELADILDQDVLAQVERRVGADSRREDPVIRLHRLGKIDDAGLRAAREVMQVVEVMRDGGIFGVRAMDPMAVRVDGGGGRGDDMLTRTVLHPAVRLVGEWVTALDAEGRVWPDARGAFRRHSEVILSVVVDRRGCRAVEEELLVRHGQIGKAVAAALATYAEMAGAAWAKEDKALERQLQLLGDSS